MQNLAKGGEKGVTWPTFQILGHPPYLGTVYAKNFEFAVNIDHLGN